VVIKRRGKAAARAKGKKMTLPAFDLVRPGCLEEALEILSSTDALPIAGGTNLIPDMRKGTHTPSTLLDVSKLPELCCIRRKDGHLLIGAGVTISELLDDPMVVQDVPILGVMAKSFANALIRNRATIGGNLVNAAPCCDSAPALLALDAQVELSSMAGARHLPLAEFLVDAFSTKRQPNELLTCVRVPIPSDRSFGGFRKMGLRKISCMAKIDVAVMLEADENKRCRSSRIVLGAVGPSALRASRAEEALVGQALIAGAPAVLARRDEQPSNDAIGVAARLAGEAASPRSGSEYKRHIVEALTKRLLTQAAVKLEGGGS
jgi:carbon-monoxide dehydrogenase medium subunit